MPETYYLFWTWIIIVGSIWMAMIHHELKMIREEIKNAKGE